jgi:hypothetical protein
MGRESFAKTHAIELSGTMTLREFCKLTRDAYGGDVIRKLAGRIGGQWLERGKHDEKCL